MDITAVVDFDHGTDENGKVRKWKAGTTYRDVPESDAAQILAAGWAIRSGAAMSARPRVIVEPVSVTFHPPK